MLNRSCILSSLLLCSTPVVATTYNVGTPGQLQVALASVQAGDEIVLTAGQTLQYTNGALEGAYFYSAANGTAANPITIRSASASNLATLRGDDIGSKILLRIVGDYWVVKDLKLSNGQKGLVFDNSNYSKAIDVEVHDVGYEGIHVRDGSKYTTIDGCWVYNTGKSSPGFGEGIYIGSDRSVWGNYDSDVAHTIVQNSTIGPNVAAEAFDIKEGSSETLVQNNTLYAKGISGVNFSDSFIDIKGVRVYVRNNTFNQGGEPGILRAVAVLDRDRPMSGYENVVHDNIFNMDNATTPLLEAYSGTSEIYAYNNTRHPAGAMYSSSVIQAKPSWYGAPGNPPPPPPPPGNQSPSVSISSAISNGPLIAGQPVTISASASDSDGSIKNVAFYRGTTLIGSDSSAPYSVVWSNPTSGSYSLTAVATDNGNASRTSNPFPIIIATAGGGGGGGGSGAVAQYQRGDSDASDNRIRAQLRIRNAGTTAVVLGELKLRYWFTMEGGGTPVFNLDYAAIGSGNVSSRFVSAGGAAYYLELSFLGGAGTLAAGSDTGPLKVRITSSNYANQTEDNDYSFGANATAYQDWQQVAVYRNGTRVWGNAP